MIIYLKGTSKEVHENMERDFDHPNSQSVIFGFLKKLDFPRNQLTRNRIGSEPVCSQSVALVDTLERRLEGDFECFMMQIDKLTVQCWKPWEARKVFEI